MGFKMEALQGISKFNNDSRIRTRSLSVIHCCHWRAEYQPSSIMFDLGTKENLACELCVSLRGSIITIAKLTHCLWRLRNYE